MNKYIYIIIILLSLQSAKAQFYEDGAYYDGDTVYIQNRTYPKIDEPYPYAVDLTTISKIGNNVTNHLPKGDVTIPSGSKVCYLLNTSSSLNVIIQPGFNIETGSEFGFSYNIPVGTETITKSLRNTHTILTYGADGESLNIDPLYFCNTVDKNVWGIEEYTNGLNFWKPAFTPQPWGNYKMFISSSNGNIGIGTGSPAYKLDVKGNISSTGRIYTSSDERLKSKITPLKNYSSSLYKLQGKSYIKKIIDESSNTTSKNTQEFPQLGLIAQDLVNVLPHIVSKDSAGILSIKYLELLPIIIETLKEQKKTYDHNTEKIKQLKEYINTL